MNYGISAGKMDINVLKLPENRQIFSRQSAVAFGLFIQLYTLYMLIKSSQFVFVVLFGPLGKLKWKQITTTQDEISTTSLLF